MVSDTFAIILEHFECITMALLEAPHSAYSRAIMAQFLRVHEDNVIHLHSVKVETMQTTTFKGLACDLS